MPKNTKHIGAYLSKEYALEMAQNRRMLAIILSSIRYLARQALAFRGHGDDGNGNSIQLLKLQGEENSEVPGWLQKKAINTLLLRFKMS